MSNPINTQSKQSNNSIEQKIDEILGTTNVSYNLEYANIHVSDSLDRNGRWRPYKDVKQQLLSLINEERLDELNRFGEHILQNGNAGYYHTKRFDELQSLKQPTMEINNNGD